MLGEGGFVMFVIVQVDAERTRAIRMLPIQYSVESEAQAHAQVLTARHTASKQPSQFVVRALNGTSESQSSPSR